ncbi:hypothetical protein HK099_004838 [Clydaea vesicula]|uniref:non-specific serine/threonine protein kinase n=1 Tax=Clydaea vesicula TaxID=447962 RepID=A0AAD5TZX2_9FUNG|nr:hypothetical protein HK099_004838 [Clydaea vesicula]
MSLPLKTIIDILDHLFFIFKNKEIYNSDSRMKIVINGADTVLMILLLAKKSHFYSTQQASNKNEIQLLNSFESDFLDLLIDFSKSETLWLRILSWKSLTKALCLNEPYYKLKYMPLLESDPESVLFEASQSLKCFFDVEIESKEKLNLLAAEFVVNFKFLINIPLARNLYLTFISKFIENQNDLKYLSVAYWWDDEIDYCFSSTSKEVRVATCTILVSIFGHKAFTADDSTVKSDIKAVLDSNGKSLLLILDKFISSADHFIGDTIIWVTGEIGRISQNSLPLVIRFYLEILSENKLSLSSLVYSQATEIAKHRNQNLEQLFQLHLEDISIFLINKIKIEEDFLLVENISTTFFKLDLRSFLTLSLQYILPHLVLSHNESVLNMIAKIVEKQVGLILVEKIQYIMFQILLNNDKRTKLEFFLNLLNSGGNYDIVDVAKTCSTDLVEKLAIELGDPNNRKKAETELNYVRQLNECEVLSDFLQTYLLRVLININKNINLNEEVQADIPYQIKLLKSLNEMIKMIGRNIYTMLSQIMATLQTALNFPHLQGASLLSWETLVKTVEVKRVQKIVHEVVAVLMKNFDQYDAWAIDKVGQIFDYLIIQNESVIYECLSSLSYFPASTPNFVEMNKIIQKHRPKNTIELLEALKDGVSHDNSLVSFKSLQQLKEVLLERTDSILNFSLADTVPAVISMLLKALFVANNRFDGCLDIQILCCECIGIIGAIDPSRLQTFSLDSASKISSVVSNDNKRVYFYKYQREEESRDFVFNFILSQLIPAFRSTQSTLMQGHLSYALQELMKHSGMTLKVMHEKSVPEEIKDTLVPFFTSKYLNESIPTLKTTVYPIYPRKSTHKDWLNSWTTDLVQKVGGKSGYHNKLFSFCRDLMETNIASFLLPNLVLSVLIELGDADSHFVLEETLSVLGVSVLDDEMYSDEEDDLDLLTETPLDDLEKRQLCTQTIFSLIDHLSEWTRMNKRRPLGIKTSNPNKALEQSVLKVETLLDRISQKVRAVAAFRCKAYARALMHYETYFREKRKFFKFDEQKLQPYYGGLQKIYSFMDDIDGLEGISAKFSNPSLDQQILEHESRGAWTAAQTLNELGIHRHPSRLKYHLGLLNCLKNLNHMETMLTHIDSTINVHPEWSETLNSYGVEASWKLGKWESLESYIQKPHKISFETLIGDVIIASRAPYASTPFIMKKGNSLEAVFEKIRTSIVSPLAAASVESYRRSYAEVLKLHMIYEMQTVFEKRKEMTKGIDKLVIDFDAEKMSELFNNWEKRLKITTPAFRTQEPILTLRRILLSDFIINPVSNQKLASVKNLTVECGRIWVQTAKLCENANHHQTAFGSLLHASELEAPNISLERAKWFWNGGQNYKAISELQLALTIKKPLTGVTQSAPSGLQAADTRIDTKSDDYVIAKTHLRLGGWLEEINAASAETILKHYIDASKSQPSWEKTYYYIGRYYSRVFEKEKAKESRNSSPKKFYEMVYYIIKSYGRALANGTRYIYQTLPRILTLWLDFGEKVIGDNKLFEQTKFKDVLVRIMEMKDRLPIYQFLTAFPQLISRIDHPNQNVYNILELILVKVLMAFPQQALWQLVAVNKSINKVRSKRCAEIFTKAKSNPKTSIMNSKFKTMIEEAVKLSDKLIIICNHSVDKHKCKVSLEKDFKGFQHHELQDLKMIVPLQSSLTVALPTNSETLSSHKPFPSHLPTIKGFKDEVQMMTSLMRPRKITMVDSNGKEHFFLCKPKDDLRKDCRLMEFNSMINKLLKKDPESRKRQLYIRTYAVIPLNEECGIIEWVNNTVAFRHSLTKIYDTENLKLSSSELKKICSMENKFEMFTKHLLPRYPPIFHKWFLQTFLEPTEWFTSRLAYSSTLAVMSIVGFVVGLGDRHGENILFDKFRGDCVHVDLNCLFEKGETFEVPEVVPFRLTQNIVDACGVTGVEGVFRKCCEVTLRVLRSNRECLMSVLETFLHDPLCEWSKVKGNGRNSINGQGNNVGKSEKNEQALKKLKRINEKLIGHVYFFKEKQKNAYSNSGNGVAFSVEAQVHELICQATSLKNLSEMYVVQLLPAKWSGLLPLDSGLAGSGSAYPMAHRLPTMHTESRAGNMNFSIDPNLLENNLLSTDEQQSFSNFLNSFNYDESFFSNSPTHYQFPDILNQSPFQQNPPAPSSTTSISSSPHPILIPKNIIPPHQNTFFSQPDFSLQSPVSNPHSPEHENFFPKNQPVFQIKAKNDSFVVLPPENLTANVKQEPGYLSPDSASSSSFGSKRPSSTTDTGVDPIIIKPPPSKKTKHTKELLTEYQKKQNHVVSEKKRRTNIKAGFAQLVSLVPELTESTHKSEAVILQKSIDYIHQLIQQQQDYKLELTNRTIKMKASFLADVFKPLA